MYATVTQKIKLCPYLLEREEEYPCDKPEDCCNAADCEVYKIVVDMGAY
jgi:hypothetical protein